METPDLETIQVYGLQNGKKFLSHVTLFEIEYGESVQLSFSAPIELKSSGENYFGALTNARLELERNSFSLYCYGSALNFHPSPFLQSSGVGRVTYRLVIGKPALNADIVDIFDYEDGLTISTVEEQEQWYKDWLQSLKSNLAGS